MVWMIFVAGAVLSWGSYGVLVHQGQTQLGNPLKALLCVGVAYFLVQYAPRLVIDDRHADLAGAAADGGRDFCPNIQLSYSFVECGVRCSTIVQATFFSSVW